MAFPDGELFAAPILLSPNLEKREQQSSPFPLEYESFYLNHSGQMPIPDKYRSPGDAMCALEVGYLPPSHVCVEGGRLQNPGFQEEWNGGEEVL